MHADDQVIGQASGQTYGVCVLVLTMKHWLCRMVVIIACGLPKRISAFQV
jgi:hypothetical protein